MSRANFSKWTTFDAKRAACARVLSGHAETLDSDIAELGRALLPQMADREIRIGFGGHFKSGKSTLLNGLLRKELLPTGDLRETGVACEIRRGWPSKGRAVYRSETKSFAATMSAVRDHCSLILPDGRERDVSEFPQRLEINLSAPCIPKRAVWIDSPGINDPGGSDEHAASIAASCDALVWVLNSKQCFSTPEQLFLARHIQSSGAQSVLLVLNCFLASDDEAAWNEFAERQLPVHRARISKIGSEAGLPESCLINVLPVVANRLRVSSRSKQQQRDLLTALDGLAGLTRFQLFGSSAKPAGDLTDIPFRTRTHRIQKYVQDADREISEKYQIAQDHYATSVKKFAAYETAMRSREAFSRDAIVAVREYVASLRQSISSEAESYAQQVSRGNLHRDNTYTIEIFELVQSCNASFTASLLNRLEQIASRARLEIRSPEELTQAVSRLQPTSVTIDTPNIPAESGTTFGGAAGGAAAGAAIGSVVPIIGTLLGGLIGGFAGAIAGESSATSAAIERDVQALKALLPQKALECIAPIERGATKAGNEIVSAVLTQEPTHPGIPSKSEVEKLEQALAAFRSV
jgi:hypothetical protein